MQITLSFDSFTELPYTSGTIQNISSQATVEICQDDTANTGLILGPGEWFSWSNSTVYARSAWDYEPVARCAVVPFKKGGEGGGSEYILPVATKNTLGGVKSSDEAGAIKVDALGKMTYNAPSSTPLSAPDWETNTAYPENALVEYNDNIYICLVSHTSGTFADDLANGKWKLVSMTLNAATSSELGGVKSNSADGGVTVDSDGKMNINLPKATSAELGGVKIGSGLSITADGTLSATGGGGGGNIEEWTSGTSYSAGDVVIKDQALYQANTDTSTTWVDSEWNIIGTTFNTTSAYAQKIVTNVVAPYEMLLQVGDSNYCKPPIDVLKKTGGSSNTTLTLENYNNASAYTGTSDFLKIENSKAKLYNYKEYSITPQTLSTIDIGVSDEIDFDEFASTVTPMPLPDNVVLYMPFNENLDDACGNTFTYVGNPVLSSEQSVYGTKSLYLDGSSRLYFAVDSSELTFGTNDFTFAWWEYRTASGNGRPIITYSSVEGNIYNGVLNGWVQGNMVSLVSVGTGNWNVFPGELGSMGEASYNTWTHYALTREGNTFRTFKNGNLITASIASGALHEVDPRYISIGYAANTYYQGYINNLLVVNGEALYTENFTPPIRPYSTLNYNISSLEVN